MKRECGSSFLYVIAGLVIMSAVGAGMANLSPKAAMTGLMQSPGCQARYLAFSGANMARLMTETELDQLVALGNSGMTYTCGQDKSFKLVATAPTDGVYPVNCIGNVDEDGPRESHFSFRVLITPVVIANLEDYAIASLGDVDVVADRIEGDVYGDDVEMFVGEVDGNINATGHVRMWVATVVEGDICAAGDVIIPALSLVGGTIKSGGNVTAGLGVWIGEDVFAVEDVTMVAFCEVEGDVTCGGRFYGLGVVRGDTLEGHTPIIDCEPAVFAPLPSTTYPPGAISRTNLSSLTITGGAKTYYQNLSFRNSATLTLDLTAGDVEVFVGGDLSFGRSLTIRIIDATGTHTFTNVNDDGYKTAAAGVYFEILGTATMGRDCKWLGTMYSKGDITIDSGLRAIGALISRDGVVIHGSDAILRHQAANYFTGG